MTDRFASLLYLLALFSTALSGPRSAFVRYYEGLDYDRLDMTSQHERARRSSSQSVKLEFRAHGRHFDFHMRPDTSIFTEDVEFVNEKEEPIEYDQQRVYRGAHRGDPNTIIYGVMSQDGTFDGAIHSNSEKYYIEPSSRHKLFPTLSHSVIYKASDVVFDMENETSCAVKEEMLRRLNEKNKLPEEEIKRRQSLQRRVQRYKRAAFNIDDEHTECRIQIVADQKLYKHLGNNENAALSLLVRHVLEVNTIFPATDFDLDERGDNIRIAIRRAAVWKEAPADTDFDQTFLGVDKFLDSWSLYDHHEYCLAYLFTYRDFDEGVLGLAFVGSTSSSTAGGICEDYTPFTGGVSKSLNTGVVSLVNYGQTVPITVSRITFAHEIGHNFGSNHDMSGACAPGGTAGNYIMYFRATSGTEQNNDQFSLCSRDSMGSVIQVKGQGAGCFENSTGVICGNGVIEGDEECDCGFMADCTDSCCYSANEAKSKQCRLKTGVVCSPQQGPCCNEQCEFQSNTVICQEDDGCKAASNCSGVSATCPDSPDTSSRNGHFCKNERRVCVDGECTGSICLIGGYEPCECLEATHFCDVCCEVAGTCVTSFSIESLNVSTKVPPGTACNQNQGYCDYFHECRLVDLDGPIARLKNLLFSTESIETAKEWLTKYWWGAALIGVGVILLMAGFIWLCSKKTPKSYPKPDGGNRRR
ncbi:disintegrin and metalloproteinase domain-containing protein 10-like [Corticium candelabrum]|uniref:disintegrin and metalloproteinase domain-containing protein 10-like n=1 Tax=Corticium candelabrum TaxID=121492 RepID=UPI002E26B7F1|nr:disintegrin and metalloproteinase domain-containing protein 10-like [Corticium candelabrum]